MSPPTNAIPAITAMTPSTTTAPTPRAIHSGAFDEPPPGCPETGAPHCGWPGWPGWVSALLVLTGLAGVLLLRRVVRLELRLGAGLWLSGLLCAPGLLAPLLLVCRGLRGVLLLSRVLLRLTGIRLLRRGIRGVLRLGAGLWLSGLLCAPGLLAPLLLVCRGLRGVLLLSRVLLLVRLPRVLLRGLRVLDARIRLLRGRIRLGRFRGGLLRPLELLCLVATVLWRVLTPRL